MYVRVDKWRVNKYKGMLPICEETGMYGGKVEIRALNEIYNVSYIFCI
jgi:hypothetical protein